MPVLSGSGSHAASIPTYGAFYLPFSALDAAGQVALEVDCPGPPLDARLTAIGMARSTPAHSSVLRRARWDGPADESRLASLLAVVASRQQKTNPDGRGWSSASLNPGIAAGCWKNYAAALLPWARTIWRRFQSKATPSASKPNPNKPSSPGSGTDTVTLATPGELKKSVIK